MWVGGMRMSTMTTFGRVAPHLEHEVLGRAGLGDDLEALVLEQPRDALAQEDRVLGEDSPARELRPDARPPARRALDDEPAVERLDAVDEAAEARALGRVGAADGRRRRSRRRACPFTDAMLTATEDASAYLATFASASETT